MPSTLEEALESLVVIFHKYSGKEGNKSTLSKREFKNLMQNEFTSEQKLSSKDIRKLMDELDVDQDQELNFQEYITFLGQVAIFCNDSLQAFL
ncbi:protein S100-A6-like [Tachyglossus aculeatus]|uniref:protein S100-A6-like n=1 Tax=Tachyglossus aculeatus TaxID=9261 RepID=UPI0018F70A73|nr:protein S100-A6-like [Tachyglossus aculeatus]